MLYVTRRAHFSAAHRLFNPTFSNQQNEAVFDKCNNPMGHGHNYELEVTVKGLPDPQTGYVIDLKVLAAIIDREIIDRVDHRHLNHDVDILRGIIPTAENLVVSFWSVLETHIPGGTLHAIRLYESANNFVDYYGEPVAIQHYQELEEEGLR